MKKNRSVRAFIVTGSMFAFSFVAFAAGEAQAAQLSSSFMSIGSIVNSFTNNIVNALVTLFATAALVAFFFGIVQYIWGMRDGKPEKVKNGNSFMVWGLIGLFVMFSVWGIIIFFQTVLGLQNDRTIYIPEIRMQQGSGGAQPAALPGATPTCGPNEALNSDRTACVWVNGY